MRVKSILLFLALHITLFSFSQQGINYQAIVKDSDGMILKDSDVSIKFSLIYEDVNSTPIYIEEHQITTPSDGIVNIYIGSGTKLTTGVDFSEIDWSQNVFLKEELDTSGNYETMGTNQIASVPVAEFSRNTASIFTTSNTIQLGNDNIELVNTSGIVSATGFVGDGSGLTDLNLSANYDDKGNLIIIDFPVSYTESNTNNTVIGKSSMASVTLSRNNVAVGRNALREGSTSYDNVAVGLSAMREAKYSQKNTAIGAYALMNIGKNLDRYYDFYEDGVMYSNQNTALGNGAAAGLLEGTFNTSFCLLYTSPSPRD